MSKLPCKLCNEDLYPDITGIREMVGEEWQKIDEFSQRLYKRQLIHFKEVHNEIKNINENLA